MQKEASDSQTKSEAKTEEKKILVQLFDENDIFIVNILANSVNEVVEKIEEGIRLNKENRRGYKVEPIMDPEMPDVAAKITLLKEGE